MWEKPEGKELGWIVDLNGCFGEIDQNKNYERLKTEPSSYRNLVSNHPQ